MEWTGAKRVLAAVMLAGGLAGASAAEAQEAVLATRVEVGQQAPDFSLEGIDGERFALSDLRGEKDLILVFFRGTW